MFPASSIRHSPVPLSLHAIAADAGGNSKSLLSLSPPLRVNIGLRRASRAAQQPLVFSLSLGAVSAINLSGVRSGKELKTAVDD